jgi:hypothetical protein
MLAAGRGPAAWLCPLLVALLAAAVPAQDNDDGGVLPKSGGGFGGSSSDDGAGSMAALASGVVGLAGELAEPLVEATLARIEVWAAEGDTTVVTDVDASDATFACSADGLSVEAAGTGVLLQGDGVLRLREDLEIRMCGAPLAGPRQLLLVLESDEVSLQDQVAGLTQPALVVPLGAPGAVDLRLFAAIVAKHAHHLQGLGVSLVFASVAPDGELHVSAVRASTAGGDLEVVID